MGLVTGRALEKADLYFDIFVFLRASNHVANFFSKLIG